MNAKKKAPAGRVFVNTGKGKGKTTAALGQVMRAWGHDFRICVFQFMKSQWGRWGEATAAERMGIEWHQVGEGFSRGEENKIKHIQAAREGWKLAQDCILSGSYDLLLLDEFTYPLNKGWLEVQNVSRWLEDNKPLTLHLIITGREAPQQLIEYADTVTKMHKVKHAYDQGIHGQLGLEF